MCWSLNRVARVNSHVTCECVMSHVAMLRIPFKEEIRLKIPGFRDLSIFPMDLLNDGDSFYTRENVYENLGTSVKTCLVCMGTSVKNGWKFWQS